MNYKFILVLISGMVSMAGGFVLLICAFLSKEKTIIFSNEYCLILGSMITLGSIILFYMSSKYLEEYLILREDHKLLLSSYRRRV